MVLYVSDLDGTLLNDQSVIEPATIDKLNKLIDDGVHFTIATARAYPSICTLVKGLDVRLPVIEQNGAVIRDYASGHVLEANLMTPDDVTGVCDVFDFFNVDPAVSILQGDDNPVLYNRIENPGMEWAITAMLDIRDRRELIVWNSLDTVKASSVLLFRYLDTEARIREIAGMLKNKIPDISVSYFHNFFTDGWEINVSSLSANKGTALKLLRQHATGVRKVVVFGDSANDMDMFHHADEAYAVANATRAIRNKATAIIGLNTEDAVVNYIEQRSLDILTGREA